MGQITLLLRTASGDHIGILRCATLLGRDSDDLVEDVDPVTGRACARIREAQTYRYGVELADGVQSGITSVEPSELFERDTSSVGRLRPREAVGRVAVAVRLDDGRVGHAAIVVRAAKLEHETEYRQMLSDISEYAVEALIQGFAPSSHAFHSAPEQDAPLLFQRFAVLHHWLQDPALQAAVQLILRRPQTDWIATTETLRPGRPVPAGPRIARRLTRDAPRRPAPHGHVLSSLPRDILVDRHEITLDTPANRTVKWVLIGWSELAAAVLRVVEGRPGGPSRRGAAEAKWVLAMLDEWLAASMFRDVGRLAAYPSSNQVLLRREGYRELLRAWTLTGAGLDLVTDVSEPFHAGQRSVATLYEYWVFLQLASATGAACGEMKHQELFEPVDGGMALGLKRGRHRHLQWKTNIDGRELEVSLHFNRSFGQKQDPGSWAAAMRPDVSLRVSPALGALAIDPDTFAVWVHFDAKYRKDVGPQFASQSDDLAAAELDAEEVIELVAISKRDDVLKMHAYRDAIRQTAGAYVIFPGDTERRLSVWDEILPGVGALPLRPSSAGEVVGAVALTGFVKSVLEHLANQATRHERLRYWSEQIRIGEQVSDRPEEPSLFLDEPPADTRVLVAQDHTRREREFLMAEARFVLPVEARSRAIQDVEFIVVPSRQPGTTLLVQRIDGWEADAGGRLACRIAPVFSAPSWVPMLPLATTRREAEHKDGAVVATTWASLMAQATKLRH